MERSPNPSLPLEPPKTRVKFGDLEFARQNTEKPVRRGNIHSGKISHNKNSKTRSDRLNRLLQKYLRKERHIEKLHSLFVAFCIPRIPFLIERIEHGDQGEYAGV